MRRTAYAYAWDVLDAAPTRDALRETGLDGITVSAAYHAGKFITPNAASGRVIFPEDGTVTFHTDPGRYGALKPQAHSLLDRADPLADLASADLKVTAWVVLLHNARLGFAHPEACVRNAFGDPYLYSLSPTDPDVRAYARALVADLGDRYDLEAVVVETPGTLPYVHGYHHEFQQVALNGWLTTLLGLSFTDHDVTGAAAAGIDAERLRRRVADRIDRYLAAAFDVDADVAAEWMIADLVGDLADLPAYMRWQAGRVTALVAEIRQALRQEISLGVIPTVQRPTAASWREGTDLRGLRAACDFLEVPFYEPRPDRAAADRHDVAARAGDGPTGAILRPAHPDMTGAAQIGAHIAAVRGPNLTRLSFYNWGLMRPRDRAALRAALEAL
ncbi:MAG: hypothetical protein ACTS3R_08220 [Inquilinaceae bacterium]